VPEMDGVSVELVSALKDGQNRTARVVPIQALV